MQDASVEHRNLDKQLLRVWYILITLCPPVASNDSRGWTWNSCFTLADCVSRTRLHVINTEKMTVTGAVCR